MKILFIISSLGQGGAENVMAQLANNWSEDHEVHLLTIRGEDKDFFSLSRNVKRHSLGVERSKWYNLSVYVKLLKGLRKTIKSINPDYAVSFVIKTNIFSLIACPKRIPLVVCEHSILDRGDIDKKQRLLRRWFYPRAYKVGVLTKSIKKSFHELYPAIPEEKVSVIPNPINIDANFVKRPETEKVITIVSLGRLVPLKGFDKLIKIFSLYHKANPRSRLIIYGEGSCKKELQELILSLHLEDSVILAGYTNNPVEVIGNANVYAVTSDFEGFPMSVVEALAVGTPCIGFDVPGVNDLIENGINGILIEKGNLEGYAKALDDLKDPVIREDLIREGKKIADKLSMKAVNDIWFKEVLAS